MELLRRYLFIYLLAILLLLSISSTTNSDHTNAEIEWKGGDGAKRSRVRRQNLHLPDGLRLPEKAYALYVLWRLLNEVSNDTNTIKTSTMTPDKLESMTSEGPKNTEIVFKAEDNPSSAPTQEQSTHYTGITVMTSFPTDPSSPDLQKTTQSGDSQLVKQSPQRLQTIQKIPEPSQVTEQHIPDSTTLTMKISSKTGKESSSTIIHERIGHFTGITDTNDSTAMASFPTHSPDSQTTTQSRDSQLVEQLTISKQKMTEPSQATEQHIPYFTTFTIKIPSKAVEELSSTTIHDQIAGFTDMTGTPNSTAIMSFSTELPPQESQNNTQSGATHLYTQQSTQHLQRSKQEISEPSQVSEKPIPESTTLTIKISSKAAEEPSSTIIHERIDDFTGITDTKDSTVMASFPTHSPDSQTTTQSEDSQLAEQSRIAKQKITEPSQVTEQHIPDSTALTIKISSKAVKESSSTIIHKQIGHFTGITDKDYSTAMASFPTHSPDSQETTQSGDSQLVEQLTISKQKMTEPSQATEQHIPYFTTFTIKIPSKAVEELSSTTIHDQIAGFTDMTGTPNSTAIMSFSTELPPQESQNNTQSGAPHLFTQQSTQHIQRSKQEISEPSQVSEKPIPESTTLTIKISSKAAEEPSSTIIHERIEDFTGITDTKDSTVMASFPTHSPDSQTTTQSEDSQLAEQSRIAKQKITEPSQVTEQHIPDSTALTIKIFSKAVKESSSTIIHKQIGHFTGITDKDDSTAMASFPTHSPDSQETTQSGDSQLVEQLTISKQKMTEPSQATEQHIPYFTTFTIKIPSKAVEELSSTTIHDQIAGFTDMTGTPDSTAIMSFSTELPPQESQNNTQSGAPHLFTQQSTQHLQRSKQDISEPSQVTEQLIPDSTTLTIKISSQAVKEPSSNIIHEQFDHFTGISDTNDSTAMASFPTHSPDSKTTTQSEDSQLAEQSRIAKQKITEPSQVTEQHIPDSTTFTIKMSSEPVEEHSLDIMQEESPPPIVINDSTTITSFSTELPPKELQKNTQSGAPQLFTQQSNQHIQRSKHEISEPSQVSEKPIPESTTLTIKISSKAAEEPSSTIIHERIDNFTGITDTKDSTAMASFPTHSPDSQETAQSGDYKLVEQSRISKQKMTEPSQVKEQHIPDFTTFTNKIPSKAVKELSPTTIHDQIAHFTDMTGKTDSTAIMSFHTDQPSQRKQSTQHFQRPKIPLISTRDISTEYRNEKETPLQTAINSHITNHGMLASTRENDSLEPTSLLQTMKHEHPRSVITGMVKGVSRPTLVARTKTTTLSSSAVKLEILETATYTHSVTWHNFKPNQFMTATNRRDPKPTPPAFTMKQQIQDSTSLLLPVESPISHITGFPSDPETHKFTPAEEPTNQHTEKNAINTAKSSRDSLMQHFMTTRILTNGSSVSRKTDSTSPLPSLTEDHLVDSREPGEPSVPTGISLHFSTSSPAPFRTYQMNPKTQSQSITNKYPILGTILSHTSILLVKDTQTKAPKDRVRSSQTSPVFPEKLTVTFAPNPKPSENHILTTSVGRYGFLTLRTQEIPSWISTKRSNLQPTKTTEPRSDLTNQEPTADTVAKENYTNNDLFDETEKPTQSTIGRKLIKTTRKATTKFHMTKTQNVSNSNKNVFPTHKSADTAITDDKQTHRGIFGLFFTLGCLILLIIVILLRVVRKRWQTRHWRNKNMWVAGHPPLWGTYHSVLQSSSQNTAIEMTERNTQKNKQENSDVYESIALKQHKDLH